MMLREKRGRYRLGDPKQVVVNIGLCRIAREAASELREIKGVHAIILIGLVADGELGKIAT